MNIEVVINLNRTFQYQEYGLMHICICYIPDNSKAIKSHPKGNDNIEFSIDLFHE